MTQARQKQAVRWVGIVVVALVGWYMARHFGAQSQEWWVALAGVFGGGLIGIGI